MAVALAQAQAFGFDTVACSSTGNLANAVAAHAARLGLKAWIFIPSDLEPAKDSGHAQVFGANVVRIAGNYDPGKPVVLADCRRAPLGIRTNVNLRPYYAEGSKTVGFENRQSNWGGVCRITLSFPWPAGPLITKIKKAFDELGIKLELVEEKPVKFFGAQATGCSPISTASEDRQRRDRSAETGDDRALARYRQSRRRALCHQDHQAQRRMERGC